MNFLSYDYNFLALQGDNIPHFMSPFKWFKNETLIEMYTETSFTGYALKIVIAVKGSENEDDSIAIKLISLYSQR